jgi:hypothetical protein
VKKVREEKWSKERSSEKAHCTGSEPRLQTINLGRAVYGEILILTRGRLLKGEILILV